MRAFWLLFLITTVLLGWTWRLGQAWRAGSGSGAWLALTVPALVLAGTLLLRVMRRLEGAVSGGKADLPGVPEPGRPGGRSAPPL